LRNDQQKLADFAHGFLVFKLEALVASGLFDGVGMGTFQGFEGRLDVVAIFFERQAYGIEVVGARGGAFAVDQGVGELLQEFDLLSAIGFTVKAGLERIEIVGGERNRSGE